MYTDIFDEKKMKKKMREIFTGQKLLTFFLDKKYWHISDINLKIFNKMLTNDIISFE